MKLFFRLKDGRWEYMEETRLYLRITRNEGKDCPEIAFREFNAVYQHEIASVTFGDQAERDAESAIRALLPPPKVPVKFKSGAELLAEIKGEILTPMNPYDATDYHVEFHTGEVTPPSPPSIKKSCEICKWFQQLNARLWCHLPNDDGQKWVNEIGDTVPCDDWEAKG